MRTTRTAIAFAALALGTAFTGCSDSTPQEARDAMNNKLEHAEDKMTDAPYKADTRQEWVAERNDVLADLRGLRSDIDTKLGTVEVELAAKDLKPSQRQDKAALRDELKKEKDIMERLIGNVEGAREDNWNTVKLDTRRATDEVQSWWARFKDNIDKKTAADHDHDGH